MGLITRTNLPLNALRAFEAVARAKSFRAGAQALSVTQSAVSRHIAVLEAQVSVKLFLRRPNGVDVTQEGAQLLEAVSRGLGAIEQAMHQITGSKQLRIHIPPAFLHSLAMPFLREFREANPDVSVDLSSTIGTGIRMDGLDLAIVFDRPRVGESIRDLLWEIQLTPVCKPELVSKYRDAGLSALMASEDLLHVRIADEPANLLWARYAAEIGYQLDHSRGVIFETMTLAIDYAIAGMGVALADVTMYADRLKSGDLATPFPSGAKVGYGYYLQINPEAMKETIVRRFRASLIDRFSAFVSQTQPSSIG
ncbi:LysR family transcriptional regulator [Sphingobium boeckii]|uniref:LysR family glycine cleavage system transcriptional activator n=1 Tax=Sphingobium boeckii TaxID=1082345 RepID=A0A7W9AIL4_9SPHN|nr:LysR family transcriptional regulator [Sphingobium boeckii]MBB5686325.1 LysR family glycine cleavage system transcriptional activator [Sphingobium boeckii]